MPRYNLAFSSNKSGFQLAASKRRTVAPTVIAEPEPPASTAGVVEIGSLDMEARGVGRLAADEGGPGKVIFVEGALPGERVEYASYRKRRSYEQASLTRVLRVSAMRTTPRCVFFDTCGGCSMQHLEPRAQVAIKQRVLEDDLRHIGKLSAETMLRPILGPTWGYRYRARLAVRHVATRGGVLVGFHERKSSYIADMTHCEILPPHISALILPLRELVGGLSIHDRLPQIEVAVGARVSALVFRILEPLSEADKTLLRAFGDRHEVQLWLQPQGPDSAYCFYRHEPELDYTLPEFGIRMPFKPTDFTQVNHAINRVLVGRAVALLAPGPAERILDLFCGIGNFTLALARRAGAVVGIEGSATLCQRATENAHANALADRARFECRNLFEMTPAVWRALGRFDKVLIDPPREGALALAKTLADLAAAGENEWLPRRLVYVSCNPATLARDAALLVRQAGYRLRSAGVVNMFPHTSHVESIAVLER